MSGTGSNIGNIVYLAWSQIGVVIEKWVDLPGEKILYISVPESSETGVFQGIALAKRIKETLRGMGAGDVTLKARVRAGDHWTKEKARDAESVAKKELFK